MAIQIGKYKRPGIFIEEFDDSKIPTTLVEEGITNMVIGVSKKGPVNTPIKLTSTNDLESIFGQIDRGLERKGSFFHRTIQKMLESSSVYALNLLSTDDTLDTIDYKSISASSGYSNDIQRSDAYRKFFDTTGFWKRDTDSFLSITTNNTGYNERAFNITNLSDKFVTVFIIKSSRTGFDRTLIEWYGSQEKLPSYVFDNDYASDYLVDVVIVGGDWTNYQTLSVDNRWSKYFNTSGLIKSQIRNFANDRNISLLAYYEGLSLIPYFRDASGNNIFIETVINRDTDKTGVFCAFNADLVESDYYNGLLDLVGQTIADENETSIEFLSYKETIAESISISNTPLDMPGNVTAILGGASFSYNNQDSHAFSATGSYGPNSNLDAPLSDLSTGYITNNAYNSRTAWYAEGYIYGLTAGTLVFATNSIQMPYLSNIDNAYAVINDELVNISGATLSITNTSYSGYGTTMSFASAFVLDSTGTINIVNNMTGVETGTPVNPTVDTSDIVLGYFTFSVGSNGYFVGTPSVVNISVDTTGFNNYLLGTDYTISNSNGDLTITFLGTNTTPLTSNYLQYARYKLFNRLVSLLSSSNKDKMCMNLGSPTYKKVSLENMTISNIVTTTTSNKSFILHTGLTSADLVNVLNGYLVFYTEDNEIINGYQSVETSENLPISTIGVIGKESKLYEDFYNGVINTGDYLYTNKLPENILSNYETVDIYFKVNNDLNYIILQEVSNENPGWLVNDQFIVPSSTLNTGTFTVKDATDPVSLATTLGYTSISGQYYFAYEVHETVVNEDIYDKNIIFNVLDKKYIKMYLTSTDGLKCEFYDDSTFGTTASSWSVISNKTYYIQSAKSNYKQTIEIELPSGYVEVPNKILVNSSRYTEVKVGDFLSAYYDVTELETGEVPRKLTRILTKRAYAGDSTLTEISCDARIDKKYSGTAYQTTRYTTLDNYVSTYKGISLRGFRIRQESLPDGTETRQNSILNLVAKGTPLFKALTNKESIDFRYLIDSFGLGLIEKSKQQLVDICGDRLDVFGFINMPSMKSFKNSTSPSFVNDDDILQIEYVSKGGNPESSPSFLYSFGDGDGVTSVGYFLPYLTINDNGRPVDVPPAALAATTYMRKHTSNVSGITPWTIAAGVTNGRINGIISTEMDFTNEDIEWLNGSQMNPIVFKRNRGNVIETENTAQTLYKSALSYIHVREVLIELERELSRMLLDYQWKFNTPEVRAEIKLRADVICETFVSKNGLYNYFNKCDEENNTYEIIDNQIGVLDTYVEPIKGMGVIVNNITILRTGAISSGGFINR